MKTGFKYYFSTWVVLVVIFNLLVFVIPYKVNGGSKFESGSFWVGYIFLMLSFVGQLGIVWYVIKDGIDKTFYRIPLLEISHKALIPMIIIGVLCMVIPFIPIWLGVLVCILIWGFCLLEIMKTQATASVVESVDSDTKKKTFFIKSLTIDADSLLKSCTNKEASEEVKKVYDALRFSDPMSNDLLSGVESQISLKFNELVEHIRNMDSVGIQNATKEILVMINERNLKCKLLK